MLFAEARRSIEVVMSIYPEPPVNRKLLPRFFPLQIAIGLTIAGSHSNNELHLMQIFIVDKFWHTPAVVKC